MEENSKELIELVIAEAKYLRENATKEKDNLVFKHLNPLATDSCIYGQMTGDCFSDRAVELIVNACERVYKPIHKPHIIDGKLNGKPYAESRFDFWSPIEVFIFKSNNRKENNKRLIDYIKGETEALIFE